MGVFVGPPCIILKMIYTVPCKEKEAFNHVLYLKISRKTADLWGEDKHTDRQTDRHTDTQTERGCNHESGVTKEHNPDVYQSSATSFQCMKPLLYPL